MTPINQEELRKLAAEYFLRDLEPSELEALQNGMKDDPELGGYFVESARDEWLMGHHQSEQEKTIRFVARSKPPKRRLNRMAATITILLMFGTVFMAQRTAIKLKEASAVAIPGEVLASVTELSIFEGDVVSAVNSGKVRSVNPGDPLHYGDRVVVPVGGSLTYQYEGEETLVKMGSGALFTIFEDEGGKRVHVRKGLMKASVAKQPPGLALRITSHDAEAVVLGTTLEFLVDQFTRLSVESGLVQFRTLFNDTIVEVGGGSSADSRDDAVENNTSASRILLPIQEKTIGMPHQNVLMSIDAKRNHQAFLKFDLGDLSGAITEARLRVRVVKRVTDTGGSGHIRLYAAPADCAPEHADMQSWKQIADYQGRVEGGTDLDFLVDPSDLSDGVNTLIIGLDQQGNDFWIGSAESGESPQLILKFKNTGE